MGGIVETVGSFFLAGSIIGGFGLLCWTCTEGYEERVNQRRAKNQMALDFERKKLKLDLMLHEYQATASLEDLALHRERLNRELTKLHASEGDDQ